MSAEVIALRPEERLTREQKTLVRSVPGVAERAAHHYRRHFRTTLSFDECVTLAHLGIFRGAQLYDADKGVPFESWAFYKAVRAIQDASRKERRQSEILEGAGMAAGIEFLAAHARRHRGDLHEETDEGLFGQLVAMGDQMLLAELLGMGTAAISLSESDAAQSRIEWGELLDALKQAVMEQRPEVQQLLRLHYVENFTLKKAAELQGVSYWAVMPEHKEALQRIRARLGSLGIQELPLATMDRAAWGVVFAEVPAGVGANELRDDER
jgi:RNA polymerase sigma factor (sigma-70 family)